MIMPLLGIPAALGTLAIPLPERRNDYGAHHSQSTG